MSDVRDDVPSAPSAEPTPQGPTAQVTSPAGAQVPPDRPVENLKAEFDRKFGKTQQQLDAILQHLSAMRAPAPPVAPVTAGAEPTDDDLFAAASQGDKQAFRVWTERIAERKAREIQGTQQRTNLVTAQLQALTQRYPVLNDGAHPLTQTVQRAYQLLLQNGYAQGPATLLEAAKTAIADSPDLIHELYTQSTPPQAPHRPPTASRGQSGVMGASSRADSTPRSTPKAISPEKRALAARMGIADPAAAEARFLKRREEGRSHIGAVGSLLDTEDM